MAQMMDDRNAVAYTLLMAHHSNVEQNRILHNCNYTVSQKCANFES